MTTPDRPEVLAFDVNETLSDMEPLALRLADVGLEGHALPAWFASVLRDGFALAVSGASAPFAAVAQEVLRGMLPATRPGRALDDDVAHVMDGFAALSVHPDVATGLRGLADDGYRVVTLSNGSASVAERLLEGAGVRDRVEAVLSVEDVGVWKPAAEAYLHAARSCGVPPARVMMVAVHPWDTDGAARAGLRAAWIDRGGRGAYPGHFTPPEITADGIDHLAEALRAA
ncbi:MAG: haloacid dehalogenase type II [Thermoleophilia bacterium]